MATESLIDPKGALSLTDVSHASQSAQGGTIRVFTYISDSIAATANSELNLTTVWNYDVARISHIIVTASASVDFDIEIYPDDDFTANTHYYQNIDNNLVMNDKPIGGIDYIDQDETRELHLKIINTDAGNASTFTVQIFVSPVN